MRAMQAWSQGSDAEQKKARRLAEWLAADATRRVAAFDGHCCLFLTQKGEALKRLLNKQPAAAFPGALDALEREAERLLALAQRCNALTVARATKDRKSTRLNSSH